MANNAATWPWAATVDVKAFAAITWPFRPTTRGSARSCLPQYDKLASVSFLTLRPHDRMAQENRLVNLLLMLTTCSYDMHGTDLPCHKNIVAYQCRIVKYTRVYITDP